MSAASLLEKARAADAPPPVSRQRLELALAYATGAVSLKQARAALVEKRTSNTHAKLASWIVRGIRSGQIVARIAE